MTELNSKMSVASATAAQLSQAANTLSAIQAPSIAAGQTTVTGNTNAQQTIKQTAEALTTIVAAFNADIGKITTVASEFARVDAERAEAFNAFDAVNPLGRWIP
ncbi:TIGR04197 family type VII secretion effector [uncultured Enterococcus sp.]|uniref:TIGR04197 family type VII secretion effector n=1 Tax=uncultured Enterococcus sp. TaxID=167972 RepID=UPI002AA8ED98|nr:TIGR04197 family type VII secretion effector [uncultured Enterococcus sp.]